MWTGCLHRNYYYKAFQSAVCRSHLWILLQDVGRDVFAKRLLWWCGDPFYIPQLSSAPYPATPILARPSSVLPAIIPSCPTSVFTATPWSVNPQDVAVQTNDGWEKNPFVEVCAQNLYSYFKKKKKIYPAAAARKSTFMGLSEINCGSPGLIPNGWIENLHLGTSLGTSIIYRCNKNMKRIGASSATCEKSGRWSYNPPQCLCKFKLSIFFLAPKKKNLKNKIQHLFQK